MSGSFFGFETSLPRSDNYSTLDERLAEQDLEIYDFNTDSYNNLLISEEDDNYNLDTFGEDPIATVTTQQSVGKDFDFAGSTSKFLSSENNSNINTRQPSPWSNLDADPLLGARSAYTPQPTSYQQPPSAQVPQPQRVMRTLDDIEAELKAASLSQVKKPLAMTLEQVEAEMLKNVRAPVQQFDTRQQPQQQFPPQMQQQYNPSPQMQSAFPPMMMMMNGQPQPPRFQPQPIPMGTGMFPPQHQQQQVPFQQIQQQQIQQQQQQQRQQEQQRTMLPPHMMSQQQGGRQSPAPLQPLQQLPLQSNMLNTLFPPLPSQQQQQQQQQPSIPLTIEQQLNYLTMNQHAQHPSLTSAHLQNLLQQAQIEASQGQSKAGDDAIEEEERTKKVAADQLIRSVEMRIREHEMMEAKRKNKAAKIASMAKHNNLMSNSDKDFITRIQVSQLVTDDPYADDFYFHIMNAIKSSRQQQQQQQQSNADGPSGGKNINAQGNTYANVGNARMPMRRNQAMNRMAQNVQRLVDVAKKRNNKSGHLAPDGTLGKIATRTRSAPRQLLQVSTSAPSTGQDLLANLMSGGGISSVPSSGSSGQLSHRSILVILEQVYDAVLDLEQLRRVHPGLLTMLKLHSFVEEEGQEIGEVQAERIAEATLALERWDAQYADLSAKLWKSLRVMEPLDDRATHPFIALMSVLKGKRILPRALRHTSPEQTLTLLTLMVATFDTLDTVRDAHLLDASDDLQKLSAGSIEGIQRRAAVEVKTEAFINAIIGPVMATIGRIELRMVTGMLGLLMERNNILKVVQSRPGIAILTIFLSRAEELKQATATPDAQDLLQWQQTFTHLFNSLSSDLPSLFPSTRAVSSLPFGAAYYLSGGMVANLRPDIDLDDEPVWRFLAAVAVCAEPNEQEMLVTALKDKVVENANSKSKGSRISEAVADLKIRNVNLLLHSLGLDASQLVSQE